jgi:diguanylate cyclase (GGDEF)-like protein
MPWLYELPFIITLLIAVVLIYRAWRQRSPTGASDDVFNNLDDSIIVTDLQGRVVLINPAAQAITGRPANISIGLAINQVLSEWPEISLDPQDETEQQFELVQGAGDNKQFFNMRYSPMYDSQHHLKGHLIVIWGVTRRMRAEEAQQRRAEELAALHTTLLDITASHSLPVLLQTIVERAANLLRAYGGSLYLCDVEHREVRSVVNFQNPHDNTGSILHYGEGESGIIADTGQPLLINDYRTWPGRLGILETQPAVIALVGVPLVWSNQVNGVLLVFDIKENHHFTNDDLDLLKMFADQASIAVQNTRLFEAAQHRVQEAETLRSASAVVAATLQQDEAIHLILEQLAKVVPHDSASVQIMHEDYLEIVGGHGWEDPSTVIGSKFPIPGDNPNTIVILQRRPYILDDAPLLYPNFSKEPHNRIRSWLGVPLVVHDRVIGMLAIDSSKPGYFTPDHSRLVAALADQVAISVENTRLYQEAREAANRRAILHNVSQEIVAASLDPEGIYGAIHHAAAQLMPSEAFAITLLAEQNDTIQAVYLYDHMGRAASFSFPRQRGISGQVITSGKSLYIEDMLEKINEIDSIRYGDKEEVRSILTVPMSLAGKVIGTLSTQSYHPKAYAPEDLQLLEMLASYAAIALENSRLFGEVHKLAITDPLTGISNRRQFYELGQREFTRALRFKHPLSLILFDIDRFKNVNDTYGHTTGDLVLKTLTSRIREMIREIDIAGRYGGEEFGIILPETTAQAAEIVAERLRTEAAMKPVPAGQRNVVITLSLGIAECNSETPDFAALVARADNAMYAAKNAGRNQIARA